MSAALIGVVGLFAFLVILISVVPVMGHHSEERYTPPQAVPFSHKHHVSGLGFDATDVLAALDFDRNDRILYEPPVLVESGASARRLA